MMKTKTLLTALLTTCLMPAAAVMADGPLPTDPHVVAGDITITQPSATQLLLQQSGAAGIVDWGSFSIGTGNGVQFDNGNGATLNRVTGNDLSSIMGSLNATGSVYLVNQNGIVFGKSGVVNTGGTFVASTLDIDSGDFLAGGDDVFAGNSNGYVINLGRISALGGDVALMGRTVVNEGTITAPNGTVGLVAGREILMRDASLDDGLFSVRIGGSDTSVSDSGTIRAAAAELRANGGNVYALAGNTDGTIAATGVAKVKGRVFLTAGDTGKVQVDKSVKATGADGKGGKVTVGAGTVDIAGQLDVTGTNGGEVRITSDIETVFSGEILAYGKGPASTGGFVEVSGKHLTYDGTVNTGGGTVLIDPDNIEVTDGNSTLAGATVFTSGQVVDLLDVNNFILETTGSDTEAGSIVVSSQIMAFTPFTLTLLAHGDIVANASIMVGDDTVGGLNLVAGWDGSTSTEAFEASVFDGADLASQTIFGNASGTLYFVNETRRSASGSVFIGEGNQFNGISVGAYSGDTNIYANNLVLTGTDNPEVNYGYAQLGYNASGFGVGANL
ncbi:MAG: filamentous hemagglutinin N-terminal domain-containing protein, partial [Pseudorhodobacter sp.]|nr:filamentous hemagglutinin N-terminal domain-containing protein [Pseudorhodobacter sp.]